MKRLWLMFFAAAILFGCEGPPGDCKVTIQGPTAATVFTLATADLPLTTTAALVSGTYAIIDVLVDQLMIATMTAGIKMTSNTIGNDACALFVDSTPAGQAAVLGGANITGTVSAIYVKSLSPGTHTIEMDCWTNGFDGDTVLSGATSYTYILFRQ